MKITLSLIITFLLPTVVDAVDWIGLEPEPIMTLGFDIAQDEARNKSQSFFINKPIETLDFTFQYSTESISEFNENFDSHLYYSQLGVVISDTTYAAFSYQFQGSKNELENEQYQFQLDYSPYPAFFSFGLMTGDTHIFTRNTQRKLSTDINSYTLGIGWWFDNFAISTRHQSYNYERDPANFPRLLLFIKPAALAQIGLLVTEQSIISLSIPFNKRNISGHIVRSVSALDNDHSQSVRLDWNEIINPAIDINLSVTYSDDSLNQWSISTGLTWQV